MANEYKVPLSYVIIAALIAIVICLISIRWYDIPNLAGLISFALTVTSLVISVLAIGYAVISNLSFSQNITTLNNASEEMSTTAKDVSEAAKELKGKIEAIPTKLESMEDKFDQLISFRQTFESQDTTPLSQTENEATLEIVDLFVKKVPGNGWIGCYISFLSYKKKKSFDILTAFPFSDKESNGMYFMGVQATLKSIGILNYSTHKNLYQVTSFNEKLATIIENDFTAIFWEKFERGSITANVYEPEKGVFKTQFENNLAIIQKYFET